MHAGGGGGVRRRSLEPQHATGDALAPCGRRPHRALRHHRAARDASPSDSEDSTRCTRHCHLQPPPPLVTREEGSEEQTGTGRTHERRWFNARRRPTQGAGGPLDVPAPVALLNGSKWDQLSQDIWDKFVASQQTEETFQKKLNLWRFLYFSIKTLFPRYGLYLVGSTMSGFGLESSDMDLCLYVRPLASMDARSHALVHLGFILNLMKSFDVVSDADLIQAKVPILKFRDARHGIDVDLNCNNVVGIRNTNLLHAYAQLDWRVRPLVLVVKLWAQANDINDARRCTLSSYSLTLMVLHYLQCGASPCVLPCLRVSGERWQLERFPPPPPPPPPPLCSRRRVVSAHTLAELFLGFLTYYAHFQFDKLAVSVRAGRCVPVAECRAARSFNNDPHQWKLMCVEEPYDLTNTARSVYDADAFRKIQAVFRRSADALARGARLRDLLPLSAAAAAHAR